MTVQPTCARCGRPVHDQAYICAPCAGALATALLATTPLAGEALTTIAKLDRMTRVSRTHPPEPDLGKAPNALHPTPLPVNFHAADRHDEAVNTIHTWARHVAEERGHHIPRRFIGHHANPPTRDHPLIETVTWLAQQAEWLRHRPEAEEAYDGLHEACSTLEHVVDRPTERQVVGRCPCGIYLYARAGADFVTCQGCGTSYDVVRSRAQLGNDLQDRLLTGAQIATMAAHLGFVEQRHAARKLINKWAERHIITPHGEVDGEYAYRFGDVLPRLLAAYGGAA